MEVPHRKRLEGYSPPRSMPNPFEPPQTNSLDPNGKSQYAANKNK